MSVGGFFQANAEGLHHGEVHGEALRPAAVSQRRVQAEGSVRGRQEQAHPVAHTGLRRGGGLDGGRPTAQRTRTTTRSEPQHSNLSCLTPNEEQNPDLNKCIIGAEPRLAATSCTSCSS